MCFREIAKIEDSVKLLRDYGINLESIVRDLWVLKYNNSTMKIRFDQAKAYNVEELKTWMVRAQPEIFQTYVDFFNRHRIMEVNSKRNQFHSK